MNKPNLNFVKYINPALRILIGLMFIVSGVLKLSNVEAFKYTLLSLNFFNSNILNIFSYLIPVIEVILGILLALGIFIRFAAIHINLMVIIFAFVTYYAVSRNLNLSCGCFGGLWDMKFSWYHLLFLLLVFVLNLIFILDFNDIWSLEKIIKNNLSGANKESVIKIFFLVLMTLGIILIIFTMLLNFSNLGRNIKVKIAEKKPQEETAETNKNFNIKTITVDEAYGAYKSGEGYIFLDVRSQEEYRQGHIKDAILMPVSDVYERLIELPKNKPIIAYCNGSSCNRSGKAAEILIENGFIEVYNLAGGGIFEWQQKDYPFETGN